MKIGRRMRRTSRQTLRQTEINKCHLGRVQILILTKRAVKNIARIISDHRNRGAAEHDILRLHVAVHDVLAVQTRERVEQLRRHRLNQRLGQAALARDEHLQIAALDELLHDEDAIRALHRIENRNAVGVAHAARKLDFVDDVGVRLCVFELGLVDDLEGDAGLWLLLLALMV
jgi:hypothetical protein